MQWQWNHNPVDSKWSLTERKRWLRLHTVNVTNDFKYARNTLTQRMFGPYSTGTVEMDIRNMKDGDIAGLCLFQDPYAYVAVRMEEGGRKLVMFNSGRVIDSIPDFRGDKIWLRAHAITLTDRASFYYSTDNKSFKKIGNILYMKYRLTVFTGNKFCIFNYATKNPGGYIDINWFRMTTKRGPPNLYKADEMIEAEMYDEIYKADTEICRDIEGLKDQDITKTENGSWIRFDQIGFGKGARNFYARAASETGAAEIELHLGSADGPVIGTCKIDKTGGWQSYQTFSCPVMKIKGTQVVVLKFTGGEGNLVNLNWFSFMEKPYSIKYSTD